MYPTIEYVRDFVREGLRFKHLELFSVDHGFLWESLLAALRSTGGFRQKLAILALKPFWADDQPKFLKDENE